MLASDTAGKLLAPWPEAWATSSATRPCQSSIRSCGPVSTGFSSVPLTIAARLPLLAFISAAGSKLSPGSSFFTTTSTGMAGPTCGASNCCALTMASASAADIATPSSGRSAWLLTCWPIPPARPPTRIGNSGPSRKKMKLRENRIATKSRRATTKAAARVESRPVWNCSLTAGSPLFLPQVPWPPPHRRSRQRHRAGRRVRSTAKGSRPHPRSGRAAAARSRFRAG